MRLTRKSAEAETDPCSIKSLLTRKKGRPPNAMVGDVEERILDAATRMFLQHGFGGASLERIAEAAGAGKATLYSRYSGKEALFTEVVKRTCRRSMIVGYETPRSTSLAQRLMSVTQAHAARLLSDEVIGLIRMVIADAPRFPSLARLTRDAGRLASIEAVATMIADHTERTLDAHARAAHRKNARTLATQLLDATIAPLLMQALIGEDIEEVRRNVRSHVKQMMATFVAANALQEFM